MLIEESSGAWTCWGAVGYVMVQWAAAIRKGFLFLSCLSPVVYCLDCTSCATGMRGLRGRGVCGIVMIPQRGSRSPLKKNVREREEILDSCWVVVALMPFCSKKSSNREVGRPSSLFSPPDAVCSRVSPALPRGHICLRPCIYGPHILSRARLPGW